MNDKVISTLRTIVPAAWGSLIAWLLGQWTPPEWLSPLTDALASEGAAIMVTAIVIGAWYALWRWLEPRLPAWVVRIVLGSAQAPTYNG